MKKSRGVIGIDIGGTKISAALFKASGRMLASLKVATPKASSSSGLLALLARMVKDLLSQGEVSKRDVRGIGIGIPGLVDAKRGRVIFTPNAGLSGVPIAAAIARKTRLEVRIGNDADLGVLGESRFGAVRGAKDVVGIFIGTGVGGGVLVDGKLLTGSRGLAAELGHMTMDAEGPLCSCGNRGCLEALAGRWAIQRDIRTAVKDGEKTVLAKWAGRDLRLIKSKLLKRGLKKGDRLTKRVMKRAAKALGAACVSLRHIFDPEVIVLGGGVIEACGGFVVPVVRDIVKHDPLFAKRSACPVVASSLGDSAVMLGAAALFI